MKKLILASQSPRRRQLLEQVGIVFDVFPSDIEEILKPGLTPLEQVEELSKQKAKAAGKKFTNAIILAADTMVVLGNEMLGKPKDAKDAKAMLQKLSGTTHSIVTGFTLMDTDTHELATKSTDTKIWFREISDEEIERFIEREKPFDKAGAYAIHELAAIFVKRIEGDYPGAVGLPIYTLAKELKKFGIAVL